MIEEGGMQKIPIYTTRQKLLQLGNQFKIGSMSPVNLILKTKEK